MKHPLLKVLFVSLVTLLGVNGCNKQEENFTSKIEYVEDSHGSETWSNVTFKCDFTDPFHKQVKLSYYLYYNPGDDYDEIFNKLYAYLKDVYVDTPYYDIQFENVPSLNTLPNLLEDTRNAPAPKEYDSIQWKYLSYNFTFVPKTFSIRYDISIDERNDVSKSWTLKESYSINNKGAKLFLSYNTRYFYHWYEVGKDEELDYDELYSNPRDLLLTVRRDKREYNVVYCNVKTDMSSWIQVYCPSTDGEPFQLPALTNLPSGVTFDHWEVTYSWPSGYFAPEKDGKGNIYAYAHYVSEERKIRFVSNGELLSEISFNYDKVKRINLLNYVPAREGMYATLDIDEITEFKDYVINVTYSPTPAYITILDDLTNKQIYKIALDKGGSAFELRSKDLDGKYLYKLYRDREKTKVVSNSTTFSSDTSLYADIKDIIHITNYEEFNKIRNDTNAYYVIDNDIDFLGAAIRPIDSFGGTLEGNSHVLSNFLITNHLSSTSFALIKENDGVIRNIDIDNISANVSFSSGSDITSYQSVLTGVNNGSISNISIDHASSLSFGVKQTGYNETVNLYVGVFAGQNNGVISNCYLDNSSMSINEVVGFGTPNMGGFLEYGGKYHAYLGGFVGNNKGTISSAYIGSGFVINNTASSKQNNDNYTSIITYELCYGGFAGVNDGTLKHVHSLAEVKEPVIPTLHTSDKTTAIYNLGGLVAVNNKIMEHCSSDGTYKINSVNENTGFGGLVGVNNANAVINCSSASCYIYTNNSYVAYSGVVYKNHGTVTNTYFDGTITIESATWSVSAFSETNDGTVQYCYSSGRIVKGESLSGYTYVCGFIRTNKGVMTNNFTSTVAALDGYFIKFAVFSQNNAGVDRFNYYVIESVEASDAPEEKIDYSTLELETIHLSDLYSENFVFDPSGLAFSNEVWAVHSDTLPTLL